MLTIPQRGRVTPHGRQSASARSKWNVAQVNAGGRDASTDLVVVTAAEPTPAIWASLERGHPQFARIWLVTRESAGGTGDHRSIAMLAERTLLPELEIFADLEFPGEPADAAWQRRQLIAVSISRRIESHAYTVWHGAPDDSLDTLAERASEHRPPVRSSREHAQLAARLLGVAEQRAAAGVRPAAYDTAVMQAMLERIEARLRPNRFRAELYLAATPGWSSDALYLTHSLSSGTPEQHHAALGKSAR